MGETKTTDAVEILRRRHAKGRARAGAAVRRARLHADVATLVYRWRKKVGLTQATLARRAGTTQSVIARLEDADYEGHSLSLLCRIAEALDLEVAVAMELRNDGDG